jgi:hypothetical protein
MRTLLVFDCIRLAIRTDGAFAKHLPHLSASRREKTPRLLLPGVIFASSAYACLQGADALAGLTKWDEFRSLGLAQQGHDGETCRCGLA